MGGRAANFREGGMRPVLAVFGLSDLLLFAVQVGPAQDEVPEFIRGDINADGVKDITDVVQFLNHLFLQRPANLDCYDAADFDDSGELLISDGIYLLFYLFGGTVNPPPPPIEMCGSDPTDDFLTCELFAPCSNPGRLINSIDMEFVYIPPGNFLMGSPENERGRDGCYGNDETQHEVTLTCGFYISVTPVTQAQYMEIMGDNPSGFNGLREGKDWGVDLNRPVESVDWHRSVEYCKMLSGREGKSYRLPTEAEWEYACRAGTTTRFWFGDALECDDLCHIDCPAYRDVYECRAVRPTRTVLQRKPNPWGLFDLHDNVSEWCGDWYGPYPEFPIADPQGPTSGERRIYRGCGPLFICSRSAARGSGKPDTISPSVGFRVVLQCCEPESPTYYDGGPYNH